MDNFIKFNNQTAGRDKIFRLVQYVSRIIWHKLEGSGANNESIQKFKKVDELLGLTRRLLRFGRCLETFHSALPVFSSVSNPVVRFTSAMSRISGGCYLLIDHINCLDKLGFIKLKKSTSSRLDRVGSRLWLYAIFLGLMRDIYELLRIYKEVYRTDFKLKIQNSLSTSQDVNGRGSTLLNESSEVEAEVTKTIDTQKQSRFCELQKVVGRLNLFKKFVIEHADVTLDMSKNLCDIFLPLSSLGYVKLSSNFTSLLGVLSTILSVIPMLNPMVKMVPAT